MYLRLSPYREILQGVLTDLAVNEGIIKITGKSGAGKTALCSELFHDIESKGQLAVFFLQAPANATALQNNILASLKLDSSGNFTKTLTAYLREQSPPRIPLVLIFDDAQKLDQQSFSAIRMLCNIQEAAHALIRVILCGSEELDQKLATPALRAVTQFLSQSFSLPYLSREQVHDFCQGYWEQTASDMKPMSIKLQQKLFQETQGHPGILQARLNQGTTGAEKLKRSKGEPGSGARSRPRRYSGQQPDWIPALLIIGGLALMGGTGGYLYLTQDTAGTPVASATTELAPAPAELQTAVTVEVTPGPQPELALAPAVNETAAVNDTPAEPAITAAARAEATAVVAEPVLAATEQASAVVTGVVVDAPELPADVAAAPVIDSRQVIAEALLATAAETEIVTEGETVASPLPDIETFVAEWTESWQQQDVDAYLAHYHPEFTPAQGLALLEWQEQRRRVIANAGAITLEVEPAEFIGEAPGGMRVIRFWLRYSSATYADRTLKELLLAPVDNDWRIFRENNLRTERE